MKKQIDYQKNTTLDYIVYSIIGILFCLDYIYSTINSENIIVSFLFLIVGAVTFFEYIRDNRLFSINKFIMIYLFVFEYLAPYKQYITNYNIWRLASFSTADYIVSLILVLLFLFCYLFGTKCLFKKVKGITFIFGEKNTGKKLIRINDRSLLLLTLEILLCLYYLYSTNQLIDLGVSGESLNQADNTIQIYIMVIIRFLPIACILFLFFANKYGLVNCSKNKIKAFGVFCSIAAFIIFFPLNGTIPRYFLFAVYIMLGMIILEKVKHRSIVMVGILLGFVYIFPAFNFFKYHNITEISQFVLGGLDFNFYDYDAHQVFMLAIKYCDMRGYVYGMNILTGIFCFIPRTIWTAKLYPSGQIVSSFFNASFTNLSCPIYSEFYLAFGFLGIIVFTLIMSYLVKLYDKKMELNKVIPNIINVIVIGMSIYIMRGAFLPTMSYLFGMFLAVAIVYFSNLLSTKIRM